MVILIGSVVSLSSCKRIDSTTIDYEIGSFDVKEVTSTSRDDNTE